MVAQGVLEEGNVVNAREVLAKHDEKYTPPEVADAMKENHQGPASAYSSPQAEDKKS
ncbi:Cytochrome c-type biogenesis protein CcmE [compost metagenome]